MEYDAIIIGGGFFGCAIAIHVARASKRVLLLERESELLTRASYVNQARIHTGYHYPRSLRTAASSRENLARFLENYGDCVDRSFTALYAVARSGSKVSRQYFEQFCRQLDLPLKPAAARFASLFSPRHIDADSECEEFAFDAAALRSILRTRLEAAGVEVRTQTTAARVNPAPSGAVVDLVGAEAERARWVFNATYANIHTLPGVDRTGAPSLKHQVAEVCLIEPPPQATSLGFTILDGPFLSAMPFPARGLHSLTHVQHTPHCSWLEDSTPGAPFEILDAQKKQSRFEWMARDAARFVPCMADARHIESLFEIKTVLADMETDDARPITFHRAQSNPALISVLGGKIDNIYDVLLSISQELELV